jgi:UDP-N-acetylmuramoylalanine--D-glutamate ligase
LVAATRAVAGSAAGDGGVLVIGAGVAGLAAIRLLAAAGVRVLVAADRPVAGSLPDGATFVGDPSTLPDDVGLLVTSPGVRPDAALPMSAAGAGVEVIGEAELAWRVDRARVAAGAPARPWLVVTGTNGKTTTTGMLEAILQAAGLTATACGNIGWPVVDAVAAEPAQQVIAVELSSFQLAAAPTLRPYAGALLNLAEDHLDWHGSMAAYAAAKARALTGAVAVAVTDDPAAGALLASAPAARRIGVTGRVPTDGALGVIDGVLVDRAFGEGELLPAAAVRPPGAHNVTNALAAAALALAADGVDGVRVDAGVVAAGLRGFRPGGHRNVRVAEVDGVSWIDDSKATNPHAAAASLTGYSSVVWIAGGQLKGAAIDELVLAVRDRLRAVVLLGVDAPLIERALSRHAPDVPRRMVPAPDDGPMDAPAVMLAAVGAAAEFAAPGDAVVLAPAAASLDMFASYAARGDAFAVAVAGLTAGGAR